MATAKKPAVKSDVTIDNIAEFWANARTGIVDAAFAWMFLAFKLFASERCDSDQSVTDCAAAAIPLTGKEGDAIHTAQMTERAQCADYLNAARTKVDPEELKSVLTERLVLLGRVPTPTVVAQMCRLCVTAKGLPDDEKMESTFKVKETVAKDYQYSKKEADKAIASLKRTLDRLAGHGVLTEVQVGEIKSKLRGV